MSTTPEARLRVGHFQSTPWIPCYLDADDWPVRWVPCVSSTVGALADAGGLDLTPMATVDWFARRDAWLRLDNFGLAYRQRADSVLLFSHRPIEELDGAEIAICGETTTSVRVLYAILSGKYGHRPGTWRRGIPQDDDRMPRLLIQDQAIEESGRERFPYVYDIGHEWWTWQRTPIVSAVWVYRRGLPPSAIRAVADALASSLARYARQPLAAIAAHRSRYALQASPAQLRSVLDNFEFALGVEAEQGIDRMAQILPANVAMRD